MPSRLDLAFIPFKKLFVIDCLVRKTYNKEKPFPCGICGKSFRDQGTRKEQERRHSNNHKIPCTICDRIFSDIRNLNQLMFNTEEQIKREKDLVACNMFCKNSYSCNEEFTAHH